MSNWANGPWGMPPQMTPPWYFPQQPQREFTFDEKVRIHDEVKAYEKRLRDEIKLSEKKDDKKEEKKEKRWHDRTVLEWALIIVVTFPFWAIFMVNAYAAAFKQLGVALSNVH